RCDAPNPSHLGGAAPHPLFLLILPAIFPAGLPGRHDNLTPVGATIEGHSHHAGHIALAVGFVESVQIPVYRQWFSHTAARLSKPLCTGSTAQRRHTVTA